MDQLSTRTARLLLLRGRWHGEPLTAPPPALGDEQPPATCQQLVVSPRTLASFAPARTTPGAEAEDLALNVTRFGTADPAGVLSAVGEQFEAAVAGHVNPDVLKKALVVLDALRTDGEEAAAHYAVKLRDPHPTAANVAEWEGQRAGFAAEAKAMAQAAGLVEELMREVGVSVPLTRGVRPKV